MKLALFCYLAVLVFVSAFFASGNPVYVASVLLAISVAALFAAGLVALWEHFHPHR